MDEYPELVPSISGEVALTLGEVEMFSNLLSQFNVATEDWEGNTYVVGMHGPAGHEQRVFREMVL